LGGNSSSAIGETGVMEKNDTHFYAGKLDQFPSAWIVTGLFYTPRQSTRDMFFK
jgi:hypothetical protein